MRGNAERAIRVNPPRVMLVDELGAGRKNHEQNAAEAQKPSPTAIVLWIEQAPPHILQSSALGEVPIRSGMERLQIS